MCTARLKPAIYPPTPSFAVFRAKPKENVTTNNTYSISPGVAGGGPWPGSTRSSADRFRWRWRRRRRRRISGSDVGQLRGAHQRRQHPRTVPERRAAASVRAPSAGPGHPQTRIRARAAARADVLRAEETSAATAATAETLQDRVHQGTHAATADRAGHTGHRATGRAENAYLRAGQEAGRGSRDPHTDARTHATVQAGGLLHQIQDAGELFLLVGKGATHIRYFFLFFF